MQHLYAWGRLVDVLDLPQALLVSTLSQRVEVTRAQTDIKPGIATVVGDGIHITF
jgi:hypothetical protein